MNPLCPYCYSGEIVQQVVVDINIFFCCFCFKEVDIRRVGDFKYAKEKD
jgi:hypothetical protein